MSILASYREKEEMMRKLQDELRKMEENQQLKKELDFKKAVEALLDKYERSVSDLIDIFGIGSTTAAPAKSGRGNRRSRKLKVYVNPNTGARIETRGGNHKELKEWKAQYGAELVESWADEEQD